MDTKGFSPKDAKIIRENEGKSVYELTMLGLSSKAAERLNQAIEDTIPETPITSTEESFKKNDIAVNDTVAPITIEKKHIQPAKPVLTDYSPKKGSVKVFNANTGLTVSMSKGVADILTTKYPSIYKTR